MKIWILGMLVALLAAGAHATDLVLMLEPVNPQVPVGTEPQFRLIISNGSDHAVRFLRIGKQNAYYHLHVERNGVPVSIPLLAISDPLILSPDGSDYAKLEAGGTTNGILTGYSERMAHLPPGEYEVYLRYGMSPVLDEVFLGRSNKTRVKLIE